MFSSPKQEGFLKTIILAVIFQKINIKLDIKLWFGDRFRTEIL